MFMDTKVLHVVICNRNCLSVFYVLQFQVFSATLLHKYLRNNVVKDIFKTKILRERLTDRVSEALFCRMSRSMQKYFKICLMIKMMTVYATRVLDTF